MRLGDTPFTTAEALEEIPEWELYGPDYEQVIHGVHISSRVQQRYAHRIEAARRRAGPDNLLVGATAAWAHGAHLAAARDFVHLTGRHPRRTLDVVVHRLLVEEAEVASTPWGPATNPARTMVDVARGMGADHLSVDSRVAWVDAVAHRSRTPVQDARDLLRSWPTRKGAPDARLVLALARDGAESVKETELRLVVGRHGLPEPVLQHEVFGPGGEFVARLDLAWPERRVALEYDGAHHRERGQHSRDLARHNALRALGWTVLQVDLHALRAPDGWLGQLRALLH